jgi:putative aldouronate transport system substrate-binding protein
MYLFQYVQEQFNMVFEITEIPSTAWAEKINIAFATNEYSDFFLNGLTETNRQTYGSQGIILDLNEYITPELTPNIHEVYQKYPELKVATQSYDGHLYNISGYDKTNEREYAQTRFFINKKWAENLGVKVPTTLDEFYTYLKAIKDGDADLDGKTDDEYPISGSFERDPFSILTPVLAAYGYALSFSTGNNNTYVDVKDGKVIYVPTEPNFQDVLAYMNRLYKEQLLDNEFFTQSKDQRDAKIASGKVGAFVDWAHWLRISDPNLYSQWDGLVPMTSDKNSERIWAAHDVKTLGQFVITDKCSDPEDLMRFADWCFTMDAYLIHLGGPELGTVTGRSDGYKMEKLDASFGLNPIRMQFTFPNTYDNVSKWREAIISPGWSSIPINRTEFTMIESAATELALNSALNNNYTPYYKVGWPSSTKFSAQENEELSLIRADLDTYLRQMVSKFIVGEESLSNFDQFVAGCMSRGLIRYMQIYQAAYDRRGVK